MLFSIVSHPLVLHKQKDIPFTYYLTKLDIFFQINQHFRDFFLTFFDFFGLERKNFVRRMDFRLYILVCNIIES